MNYILFYVLINNRIELELLIYDVKGEHLEYIIFNINNITKVK